MDLDKIKEFSNLKGKIDNLKDEIEDLEDKRIDVLKDIIDKEEEKCADYFERYFNTEGFEVKNYDNIIIAKYSATKIVLNKKDETERRGHIRIYSKGVLNTDIYVKISPNTKVIEKEEKSQKEYSSKTERKYYTQEIERLKNKKSEAKEIISKTGSNTEFVLIDTKESNKDSVEEIKPLTSPGYLPKYNSNREKNYRYGNFSDIIKEKFS